MYLLLFKNSIVIYSNNTTEDNKNCQLFLTFPKQKYVAIYFKNIKTNMKIFLLLQYFQNRYRFHINNNIER